MDVVSLYSDKQKYPDDLTIEVQGEKMTMKEWRDGLGIKSEFHKHTQSLSNEKKQLADALQARETQLQGMERQLAAAMQRQGVDPRTAQEDDLSIFRNDPQFAPLVKLIETTRDQNQQLAQRLQMDEISINSWRYQQQLDKLKESDKDLDTQALAKFTSEFYNRGPDVQAAYRLMTEEARMKAKEEAAEKRGYEKAKAEPPVVPMPGGRGRQSRSTTLELPNDLNARMELAANDPEVLSNLTESLANR